MISRMRYSTSGAKALAASVLSFGMPTLSAITWRVLGSTKLMLFRRCYGAPRPPLHSEQSCTTCCAGAEIQCSMKNRPSRLLGKATQQSVLLYSCSIAIRVRSWFWGWTSRLGSLPSCAVLGLSKQVAGAEPARICTLSCTLSSIKVVVELS
jgi:hypothetical protein